MKKVLLPMACLLLMFLPTKAVTVDDILKWGGWVIETTTDYDNPTIGYPVILCSSGETRFERIDNTHLALTGMWDDEVKLVFTLARDGKESADANQLIVASGSKATSTTATYTVYAAQNDGNHDYDFSRDPSNLWIGNITEKTDGGYLITFGPLVTEPALFSTGFNIAAIEKYELEVYEPNAIVMDEVYDWQASKTLIQEHTYPAYVSISDNGEFTFLNFNDSGYAIGGDKKPYIIKGRLFDDGNMLIYSDQTFLWCAERLNGSFDPQNWCSYNYRQIANPKSHSNMQFGYAEVNGIYGISGIWGNFGITHHSDREYNWVTNDGDCITYDDTQMSISDYMGVCQNGLAYQMEGNQITPMSLDTYVWIQDDLTLDVDLSIYDYKVEDGILKVYGDIQSRKNFDNVSKYEVYLVAGDQYYSSVLQHDGFKRSNDTNTDGHSNGMRIYGPDFTAYYSPENTKAISRAADMSSANDYDFRLAVPVSEIGAGSNYTLYVKAHYNNGLEPTFHDLTAINDITLGITDIKPSEPSATVRVSGNSIIVDGTPAMTIYTTSGTTVYSGAAGTVEVTPGIYIVKADSTTTKVIVR